MTEAAGRGRRWLLPALGLALVTGLTATVVGPGVLRGGSSEQVTCTADGVADLDHSRSGKGVLDWADEFDGDAVDPARWNVRDETTLSFDQARILARNVSVADGRLVIEARRESAGGRPVTTGYLDTIGHHSRRHGRWEVRARLPVEPGASRGLWPAFWLRADDRAGEIDVVEAWGTPTTRERTDMASQYAWTVHEDTMSGPGAQRVGGWGSLGAGAAMSQAFHVFALDWTPSCLRFSIDGRTTGVVDLAEHPGIAAAIDDTVNIRLNLQVGGSYWGRLDPERPDLTRLPARLEVDHVRVYRPQ